MGFVSGNGNVDIESASASSKSLAQDNSVDESFSLDEMSYWDVSSWLDAIAVNLAHFGKHGFRPADYVSPKERMLQEGRLIHTSSGNTIAVLMPWVSVGNII